MLLFMLTLRKMSNFNGVNKRDKQKDLQNNSLFYHQNCATSYQFHEVELSVFHNLDLLNNGGPGNIVRHKTQSLCVEEFNNVFVCAFKKIYHCLVCTVRFVL